MIVGLFWIRARREGIVEFAGLNQPALRVAPAESDASN
jgi:hypothetical protein